MNENREKSIIVFILMLFTFLFTPILQADMFPKPTTIVNIVGMKEPFYFDILYYHGVKPETLNLDNEDTKSMIESNYYLDEYPITPLNGYVDEDGYISYTLYELIPHNIMLTDNHQNTSAFKLGYYAPPKTFKIVVYTENGVLLISKTITTHLFQAEVTFDLTNIDQSANAENISTVTVHQKTWLIFLNFLYRAVLTIAIELGIFWVFGYRNKNDFALIGIVNLITQSALTLFMIAGYYYWGDDIVAIITLFIGEFIVLVTELIGYQLIINPKRRAKLILYTLVANIITFIISLFSIMLL